MIFLMSLAICSILGVETPLIKDVSVAVESVSDFYNEDNNISDITQSGDNTNSKKSEEESEEKESIKESDNSSILETVEESEIFTELESIEETENITESEIVEESESITETESEVFTEIEEVSFLSDNSITADSDILLNLLNATTVIIFILATLLIFVCIGVGVLIGHIVFKFFLR